VDFISALPLPRSLVIRKLIGENSGDVKHSGHGREKGMEAFGDPPEDGRRKP
jgi:hypothetical protein